jgi:hypothetical protein
VLLRGFASQVVDTTTSSFQLSDILDGQVLLARLPKGTLGEDASRLLGSFIVAKTWQAALARAHHGETARVDASLYVDEFHNFLHPLHTSYEELLPKPAGSASASPWPTSTSPSSPGISRRRSAPTPAASCGSP